MVEVCPLRESMSFQRCPAADWGESDYSVLPGGVGQVQRGRCSRNGNSADKKKTRPLPDAEDTDEAAGASVNGGGECAPSLVAGDQGRLSHKRRGPYTGGKEGQARPQQTTRRQRLMRLRGLFYIGLHHAHPADFFLR
ncbi:hypothetical protein CDAR_35721 [Caerostris darwini]|uniref:Uncharacterized protein n=1 Tax=Caerostris darwini TaxID=1538125 RepID=A0AAV4VBS9_9ARAC|nr:hypothetical protein CDAR_35721 [Caerostris darwini]